MTEELLEVIKPMTGIENNKFQPIIKKLPDLNMLLSPCALQPAMHLVSRLLREARPTGID